MAESSKDPKITELARGVPSNASNGGAQPVLLFFWFDLMFFTLQALIATASLKFEHK